MSISDIALMRDTEPENYIKWQEECEVKSAARKEAARKQAESLKISTRVYSEYEEDYFRKFLPLKFIKTTLEEKRTKWKTMDKDEAIVEMYSESLDDLKTQFGELYYYQSYCTALLNVAFKKDNIDGWIRAVKAASSEDFENMKYICTFFKCSLRSMMTLHRSIVEQHDAFYLANSARESEISGSARFRVLHYFFDRTEEDMFELKKEPKERLSLNLQNMPWVFRFIKVESHTRTLKSLYHICKNFSSSQCVDWKKTNEEDYCRQEVKKTNKLEMQQYIQKIEQKNINRNGGN